MLLFILYNCGPLHNYVVRYQATSVIHALDLWDDLFLLLTWLKPGGDCVLPFFRVVLCDNFLPVDNFSSNRTHYKMYCFSSALKIHMQGIYVGGLLCAYPFRFVRFSSPYVKSDWGLIIDLSQSLADCQVL